jgi:DNA-binding CsgD family transcriptional regulator
MTLINPSFNRLSRGVQPVSAEQNMNRLQADLVSAARMWAADEVSAAIAHQVNEPLTALLLYLHEIQEKDKLMIGTEAVPNSRQEMVEKALHEIGRLCDIMERIGTQLEATVDVDGTVARGRESIDWWARSSNARGRGFALSAPPPSGQHLLTPREREVLALIIGGASNKEGGRQLGISTRTFEVHRAHIMAKLGARNAADLLRLALSESP